MSNLDDILNKKQKKKTNNNQKEKRQAKCLLIKPSYIEKYEDIQRYERKKTGKKPSFGFLVESFIDSYLENNKID